VIDRSSASWQAGRVTAGVVSSTFGDFVVDRSTYELHRAGTRVELEPKAFDLLLYLLDHRDRVVAKEELLDEVWGDRFVSESALTSQIKHIRRVLGDDGRTQAVIRTAHGRGYQFIAAVADEFDAGHESDETSGPGHNLAHERLELFGRQAAVDAISRRVVRHRLVSLLGVGGAGKTRLAIATGWQLIDEFPDGVWFVDLVPADEGTVDTTIAGACGLALPNGPPLPHLVRLLAARSMLLVLDNCEHLTEAVGETVDEILARCPGVRILATSREPLGLIGESQYRVQPLETSGGPSSPAVQLFVSTAERFGIEVESSSIPAIGAICDRVDGLPLAIELTAAQLRVLTVDAILERLDDVLGLLQRPAERDDRHASVSDVLAGTWALLDDDDRRVLGRLAAFPATVDVVDAEDVCDDIPDVLTRLTRLVDRSVLAPVGADPPRLRMLETVRQFTRQATDGDENSLRHAEWCLERTGSDPSAHMFDFGRAAWCARHADDLRAAELHLAERKRHDDAASLTTAAALAAHCDAGAHAAQILERVGMHLDRTTDPSLRARLHLTGAMAAMTTRTPEAIRVHGREATLCARRARNPELESIALVLQSWSTVFDDPDVALDMVERAATIAQDAGHDRARDHADSYRAFHLAMLRRYDEAAEQADVVIARAPMDVEVTHSTFVSMVAAAALRAVDEPDEASRWLHLLLALPSASEPMWANHVLASSIHASAGRDGDSLALAERALDRARRAGLTHLPDLLVPAAMLAHRKGDTACAARWLGAVRAGGRPTQSFQVTVLYRRLRERVVAVDADLGASSLDDIGVEAIGWMRSHAG